jgi:Fe-S-cluster containining protein
MTEEEWTQMETATEALPDREAVEKRIAAALQQVQGPYVCPWLARESGRCQVYEVRPITCRTYGFYVERDRGLYCDKIMRQVEAGQMAEVVWGNHDAIWQAMGATISFRERFRR